jgi:hypothetical protein
MAPNFVSRRMASLGQPQPIAGRALLIGMVTYSKISLLNINQNVAQKI